MNTLTKRRKNLHPFWILWILGFLVACNQYQPDLEPRKLGWQPDRDLQAYLNTDSMIQSLKIFSEKRQLDSLLEWTDMMSYYADSSALKYANEAYYKSIEKGFRVSQSISMYYRGLIKGRGRIQGEKIEDALADVLISGKLIRETDDIKWRIQINGLIGSLFLRDVNSPKDSALYYIDSTLKLIEKAQISSQEKAYYQGQNYLELAGLYSSDSLVFYSNKALKAAKHAGNDALIASSWRQLGMFYFGKRNLEKSEEALNKSIEFALASKDLETIIPSYQFLANFYGFRYGESANDEDFKKSMNYLRKCLSLQKESSYYTYLLFGYNFRDRFNNLRKGNSSEYPIEGDSAITYFRLAMTEIRKNGALNLMKTMNNNINNICKERERLTRKKCDELLGGVDENEFLNQNYIALVDTAREDLKDISERNKKFEKRIESLISERRLSNNRIIGGVIFIFSILVFLILLQRLQRKRLKARMEALRAQINPHFISNSLNAIDNLVNLNQREAASKYLIRFSRLSRKILNNSIDPITNLREELKTLEHFLELEKLRFRDKLTYQIDVASDIDSDQTEIPALILQPYAENAILHGIKPKREAGHLVIKVTREDKRLICIIEDDGIGREKAKEIKEKSVFQQHKSQSMKINEERLMIIGKAKGAKIQIIDLKNESGDAIGTRVRLSMPLRIVKN